MNALSAEDLARLEASKAFAEARRADFASALKTEVDPRDDRIEAELEHENSSSKSKLAKIYRLLDDASRLAEPFVACRRGCSACCHMNVVVSSLEAERLAAVSGRTMAPVVRPTEHNDAKFSGVPCPFLVNDECSVYEARPFACRNHRNFDSDSYWCQPERSFAEGMPMLRFEGARAAYTKVVLNTKLGGLADIRDFFPAANATPRRTSEE